MKKLSFLFLGIVVLWGAVPSYADNKDIQVVAVVGTARAGGRNLRAGDHVKINEIIETDENSGCKIRLGDRTVIDIAASSVFRVESVRGSNGKDSTVTNLENGGAKASVPSNSAVKASVVKSLNQKPKFYMKTKWSVIAVRGTKFFCSSGDASMAGVTSGTIAILSLDGARIIRELARGSMVVATGVETSVNLWKFLPVSASSMQLFESTDVLLMEALNNPSSEDFVARSLASAASITGASYLTVTQQGTNTAAMDASSKGQIIRVKVVVP